MAIAKEHRDRDDELTGRAADVAATRNPLKKALKLLGPGLVTGVADDDPTSIATCAVAGASLGTATLWWIVIHLPLTAAVQNICARIGMQSGRGLTAVLARHYSRPFVYAIVIAVAVSNVITLGADLGAIADSVKIVVGGDVRWLIVPVALALIVLQVFKNYEFIVTLFKWLTVALLAYVVDAVMVRPNLWQVLRATLVPPLTLDKEYVTTVVAVIGTFLTPFIFFWQSDEAVEEEKAGGRTTVAARRGVTATELRYSTIDINIGMTISTLVSYVIVLTTALTLHAHGQRHIETGAQAAEALRPLAGSAAAFLFAIGMIGTGLLTVPVLASSTAFMAAQLRKWPQGLSEKWWRATRFYAVILVATVLGVAMNFIGLNSITALYWASVIGGVVAPPLLVLTMLAARNHDVMRGQPVGRLAIVLGWISTALTSLTVLALAYVTVRGH